MKLVLRREIATDKSTIGTLSIDGEVMMFTLEDAMRDEKIAGETAIPYGTYKIEITYSPKFKQFMPLLLNVPEYEGIRIHPGNTDVHTHGCILVGYAKDADRISNSTKAYQALFKALKAATDPISIDIIPGAGVL